MVDYYFIFLFEEKNMNSCAILEFSWYSQSNKITNWQQNRIVKE